MIALIKLTEGKIIDVPLATQLNLRFQTILPEAVVWYEGKLVHNLHGSYKIKGQDCQQEFHNAEDGVSWVTLDGKKVPYYYLADPIPSHLQLTSYAVLEELQMVDLKQMIGKTDLKFEVVQLLQSSTEVLLQEQLKDVLAKLDVILKLKL